VRFDKRWAAALLTPLLAAGCSSSRDRDEATGTTWAAVTACTRDFGGIADLAAHPRRCTDAVVCPSGAYCNYGFCAVDCDDVAQTCPSGQVCSCTGQCETSQVVVDPNPDPLVVAPQALLFATTGAGARQFIEIEAHGGDLGLVRAIAPAGLRLTCVAGAPNLNVTCTCDPAGTSCDLPPAVGQTVAVPAGQRRRLWVEIDPAATLPVPPSWHVDLIANAHTHVVDVSYVPAPATALPIVGRYEGTATLFTSGPRYTGLVVSGAAPTTNSAVSWPVPVRAHVQAASFGQYVVELDDPARSIGLTGRAIVDISCPFRLPCTWTLRSADQASQTTTRVSQFLQGIAQSVSIANGRIDGTLRAEALGTTSTELVTTNPIFASDWSGGSPALGARPLFDWHVALKRTGEVTNTVAAAVTQPAPVSAAALLAEEKQITTRYDATHVADLGGDCRLSYSDYSTSAYSLTQLVSCMGTRARQFASTYQDDYLTLARQLQRGEPVSCEWQGDAPRGFIPCGNTNQVNNADVCADGVHFYLSDLNCINQSCPPRVRPCSPMYCGNDLDGTTGEGCHPAYTPQNPRPTCAPFLRDYACVPSSYVDNGTTYHGCTVPGGGVAPVGHKDLACSEAYLCNGGKELVAPGETMATPAFNQPGDWAFTRSISASADLASRDMACGTSSEASGRGRPWGTVGFFAQKDVSSPRRSPRQMLRSCVDDLRRDETALAASSPFPTSGCVQKSLFVRAAMWASNPVRSRYAAKPPSSTLPQPSPAPATPTAEDLAADSLYLRLVQQWTDIAAFVAHEGREERAMARVLLATAASQTTAQAAAESTADGYASSVVAEDEIFEGVEAAFALLQSPRFSAPLAMIPGEAIAQSDYRQRPYAPGRTNEELGPREVYAYDEQVMGVPVSMLDALSVYLELVEMNLEAANLGAPSATRDRALERLGRAMRTTRVVEAIANAMVVRARSQKAAPVWLASWDRARSRLGAVSKRVLELGVTVGDGRHPLGLEADNLPLYYDPLETNLAQHFASSAYLLRLADDAKREADTTLTAARDAWGAWMAHSSAQRQTALAAGTRSGEAVRETGRELQALCGAQRADPRDMLAWIDSAPPTGVADFGPAGCFLDSNRSECRFDAAQVTSVYGGASDSAIRYQVCRLGAAKRAAPYTPVSGVADVEAMARVVATPDLAATMNVTKPNPSTIMVTSGSGTSARSWSFPAEALFAAMPWSASPRDSATCGERFGSGGVPTPERLTNNPLSRPECFKGDLGELALQINGARAHVARQSEAIGALYASYDVAMDSCMVAHRGNAAIATAQQKHDQTLAELREEKLSAQTDAALWSGLGSLISFGGGSAGALVSYGMTASSINSARIDKRMSDIQARHEALVRDLQVATQEKICFNNARFHLTGMRTAIVDFEIARIEAAQAVARFSNGVDRVTAAVAAGRSEADRQLHTDSPILDHEPWLDAARTDARTGFERAMRNLKRRAYLASLIVGYEKQGDPTGTEAIGRSILLAVRPEQVQVELANLGNLFATGYGPGKGRPQNNAMVVSLCRVLFDTSDATPTPDATLCDGQRFRTFLADPANAAYSPNGSYIGQRLAFVLQPSLDQRIADCGERVWEIAASIQGSLTSSQPGVFFGKRNTFGSQNCGVKYVTDAPAAIRWDSTRPCLNPFVEAADPLNRSGAPCNASGMTHSPISNTQPNLNGLTDAFDEPGYTGNVVTSFSGRGLWGDYEVIVPPGELTPNLLNEIQDIYLRVLVGKSTKL
jgi:hypothetical protein